MAECEEILQKFLQGLEGHFHIQREDAAVCSVTVPFEKYDGDAIHVYVEKLKNNFVLTDMGETLGDVFLYNVYPESINDHLMGIIKSHGVIREGEALTKVVRHEQLRTGLLHYINALQQVSALEIRRRAERAQHFDVKVRNALTTRRVPYDAAWRPEAQGFPLPVDFASLNHHALFLAVGTVAVGQAQMLAYFRQKLYTYLELETSGLASGFDRVIVLDEATEWPEQARVMASSHSDHIYHWPAQSEEVEAILLTNVGGLSQF